MVTLTHSDVRFPGSPCKASGLAEPPKEIINYQGFLNFIIIVENFSKLFDNKSKHKSILINLQVN